MKIRFTVGAREQLSQIAAFVREHDPRAAERVGLRLREVVAALSRHPGMGAPGRVPGTREFQVPGLPYRIIYRVGRDAGGAQALEVLRIHHGARLPAPPDWG